MNYYNDVVCRKDNVARYTALQDKLPTLSYTCTYIIRWIYSWALLNKSSMAHALKLLCATFKPSLLQRSGVAFKLSYEIILLSL